MVRVLWGSRCLLRASTLSYPTQTAHGAFAQRQAPAPSHPTAQRSCGSCGPTCAHARTCSSSCLAPAPQALEYVPMATLRAHAVDAEEAQAQAS